MAQTRKIAGIYGWVNWRIPPKTSHPGAAILPGNPPISFASGVTAGEFPLTPRTPSVGARLLSRAYSGYARLSPVESGKWRLGQFLRPWLVAHLDTGPWIRVSGVSEFEWRALRGRGAGETRTTAIFTSLVRPGSVVLDVGANVGYYSLTAADLSGPSGRVIAFEPNPRAADRLRENSSLNGLDNLEVVQCALGAAEGNVTFHLAPDSEGSSIYAVDAEADTPIEVPVTTLDRYLAQAGVAAVDLIKIDAEGAEIDVFRGASALLSAPNAPVIIAEANPITLRAANQTMDAMRATLVNYGYTVSTIEQMRWQGEIVENWLARKS